MSALTDAAKIAADLLGPVFRCRPRDKRPLQAGWQDAATTELERIAEFWRERRDANIGLVCGVASWVLDVDGDEGLDTLGDLEDLHRWLPMGPVSVTGSGGQHLFFATSDRVRNSVRRLGRGLDTRGKGGFVVLPPSIHPNGNRYAWLPGREPWSVPLPVAPAWLLELLDPPRPVYRPPVPGKAGSRYARAAFVQELEIVALAGEGTRNHTLYKAALHLGRFIASGDLEATVVGPALVGAAIGAGMARHEAERTAASGLRTGLRGAP